MANKTYLDKDGLAEVLRKINEKYAPIAALIFKGTVADIAHLPTLADQKSGYMYNVTTGGETTSDFVEGAGHVLRDGANVVAVNVGTDDSPVFKWDIIPGVFKIEDRLQFGKEMPEDPEDEQVFLYLGETVYKYNNVTTTLTPDSDPATLGLFEQGVNVYTQTADDHIVAGKKYVAVTADSTVPPTADPAAEDYFELDSTGGVDVYTKSTDTSIDGSKTYFKLTIIESFKVTSDWDMRFPIGPEQSIDETFAYEEVTAGEDYVVTRDSVIVPGKIYYKFVCDYSETPVSNPAAEGFWYGTFDASAREEYKKCTSSWYDETLSYFKPIITMVIVRGDNPAALGLYNSDGATPPAYTLTSDTYVKSGVTYFEYEGEGPVKGVIYVYDEATATWVPQTAGDTFTRITEAEIDEMIDNLP